jgi:phosphatidylcholine synthase
MTSKDTSKSDPPSSVPVTRARQVAAFAVHLFTALGAAVAFGALIAALHGEFTAMFALLGLALAIDGVDGTLARRLHVAEILPRWSGDTLDYVVDYLNYVFVPAYALATAALLPPALAIPAAIAILISSAIYFADTRMKTADGYFRGFPALWNLVAFYVFLAQPAPLLTFVIIVAFVVLTFVPIHYVHPLRAGAWTKLNIVMLAVGAALGFTALFYHMLPPPAVRYALYGVAVYFLLAGLARPAIKRT